MIDLWDILDEIKISYIVLDMVSKRDANEKLVGALLAVGPMAGLTDLADTNVDYVWVSTGNGGVRIEALNVEDFRIDTIHLGTLHMKEQSDKPHSVSYSANPEENLKRAKKLFTYITEKRPGMLEDGSFLIDFSRYSEIPPALKEKLNYNAKAETKTQSRSGGQMIGSEDNENEAGCGTEDIYSGYHHNPNTCGYRAANESRAVTVVAKKVVSTKSFKRTSKYPIATAIESMKKKVEAVKTGAYIAPALPALKIEEEDKKEDKKSSASVAEDWNNKHDQEFFCC